MKISKILALKQNKNEMIHKNYYPNLCNYMNNQLNLQML